MLNLNFELSTIERVELINQLFLENDPELFTPNQLTTYSDYILHLETKNKMINNPSRTFDKDVELDPNQALDPESDLTPSRYTKPKIKINYSIAELVQIKIEIEKLKLIESNTTNPREKYKLRRILREMYQMSGEIFHAQRNEIKINPTPCEQVPPNLEQIDLSNPFHVKQVIKMYSDLLQTERVESLGLVLELDAAIEKTPLKPWEKHLLIKKIDNEKQLVVANELFEMFDYNMSPSYMSQVYRILYKRIAQTYEKEYINWIWEKYPQYTETCRLCGKMTLRNKHHMHDECRKKLNRLYAQKRKERREEKKLELNQELNQELNK